MPTPSQDSPLDHHAVEPSSSGRRPDDVQEWLMGQSTPEGRDLTIRMNSPEGLAHHLGSIAKVQPPDAVAWFRSALNAGEFDFSVRGINAASEMKAQFTDHELPAIGSLARLVDYSLAQRAVEPEERDIHGSRIPRETRLLTQPFQCAPGFQELVSDVVDQFMLSRLAAAASNRDSTRVLNANRTYVASMSTLLGLCSAMNLTGPIDRILDEPFFDHFHKQEPFLTSRFLGVDRTRDVGIGRTFHPGTIAMHFAAEDAMNLFIEKGWQLASRAAQYRKNSGVQSSTFDNSSSSRNKKAQEYEYNGVASLIRNGVIRVSAEGLSQAFRTIRDGAGLSDEDKVDFHHIAATRLQLKLAQQDWIDTCKDGGLYRINPNGSKDKLVYSVQGSIQESIKSGNLDVLQSLKDLIEWRSNTFAGGVDNPAMFTINSNSINTTKEQKDDIIAWLIDDAASKGKSESILKCMDNQGKSLAILALLNHYPKTLVKMLELGMDPDAKLHEGENYKSPMQFAKDAGQDWGLSIMQSWKARKLAGDLISDLQLDDGAGESFRIKRTAQNPMRTAP